MARLGDAPRGVLWDLDGTVIDSTGLHFEAWREVLAGLGRGLEFEAFRATFGMRNDEIVPLFLGRDPGAEESSRIAHAKESRYRELVEQHGCEPTRGVTGWLESLRRAGWRQALATSAPKENASALLRATGLAGAFDAVVTADDVRRGKPDPEIFLTAAARLGVAPERAIVVEDARTGIEAARRAGMCVIGLLSSFDRLDSDLDVLSFESLPPDAFERLVD